MAHRLLNQSLETFYDLKRTGFISGISKTMNTVTKSKKIFAIAGALLMGAFLSYTGARELINSIRLAREGKTATAKVVDASEWVSLKGRHTYYLTVEFQPEGGDQVRKKVKVDEEVYTTAQNSGSVKAHYLAGDPTICALGEQVETRYGNLLWGIALVIIGVFLTKQPATLEEVAEKIEGHFKTLTHQRYEYAPADPKDFQHLDLAFYNDSRRHLEERGYTFVTDQENITLRQNKSSAPSLLRYLLSRDQSTIAILYHHQRIALPKKDSKVLDLEIWFSNGHFVVTSNAAMAGKFDSPPGIDSFFLPAASPIDEVMQAHEGRVNNFLAQNPGVAAVRLNGLEDVRRAGDELQRIKSEYRTAAGLSKAELERLARRTGPEIDELHAILARRHAERQTNPQAKANACRRSHRATTLFDRVMLDCLEKNDKR